jgi:hypothetical protein
MGIGLIPATLLAGAGAIWLGVPDLPVLVVCAVVIALGAFAVSRDARTFHIALVVASAGIVKFVVFAQPALSSLLHTKYAVFSFLGSDWFVGGIAAISIPLSALFGIYGPLQGRYPLNLFDGSIAKFLVTCSTWLAVAGALYAYFRGNDLVAGAVGVVAVLLFVASFRLPSKADVPA